MAAGLDHPLDVARERVLVHRSIIGKRGNEGWHRTLEHAGLQTNGRKATMVSSFCPGSGYRKSALWKSLAGPLQSGFALSHKGLTTFLGHCKAIRAPNSA
jgi:hypothetical protein